MAFNVQSNWNANIQSLFEENSNRYIRNPNAYLLSGSTKLTGSAVTLEVKDSLGVQQYLLSTVSNPAIELEVPSNIYYVDQIDVTAFPAGTIDLIWSIEHSGSDYVLSSSVDLESSPSVVIVNGDTSTLQDYSVSLGTPKTFTLKMVDGAGNPYDGVGANLLFWDSVGGQVVETVTGSLAAASTGLWTATVTLSSSNFSPDLQRYQTYWEASYGSGYAEVENTRSWLQVYGSSPVLKAAPITYCSNDDLRTNIIGLASLVAKQVREAGEIEIILNNKRKQASLVIARAIDGNPSVLGARDLLKSWEMHLVWRACLIDSMSFAKQGANDQLIRHVDSEIYRIRMAIFGPLSSIRITF